MPLEYPGGDRVSKTFEAKRTDVTKFIAKRNWDPLLALKSR
jgi:hypothetical protein